MGPTEQTHQAEDQNNYQSCHPSNSHKMIDLKEGFQEEEDSLEEGDTWEEEECHLGDHQEAVGDHHQCPCHKPLKDN